VAAIIFDLDGVLIDTEGLQYRAYSQVLAAFGVRVTLEEYARHWIAAGRGPEYAVAAYQLPVSADELRARKHPVYHGILRVEARLMPAARETLTRCRARYPLGLATNSNRADVEYVMDAFDLRGAFTATIAREDYVQAKPAPDAYLAAAAALGQAPAQCVVVEDSHRGVEAARRAGAIPVAVPNAFTRGNDFSAAVRVLDALDALTPELVDGLVRQPA